MRGYLCFIFLFLISFYISAQNIELYRAQVKKADSLYKVKSFRESGNTFSNAFVLLDGKAYPNDRYNAACSYALAGETDSAFYHLNRLANTSTKYKKYDYISEDPDLASLRADERWKPLMATVLENKYDSQKGLILPLVKMLDTIHRDDQKYRQQLGVMQSKYGTDSEEMKAFNRLMIGTDSINLVKVKKIIDAHGWLGPDSIGSDGNGTLFLVIQHADLETQLHYLPIMREAVEKGNARVSSLALLEDRTQMRLGKKQIYGSQLRLDHKTGLYYLYPLIDPEKVNARRAEVGLGPIEDYIAMWGLTWNLEEHKKRIRELEDKK